VTEGEGPCFERKSEFLGKRSRAHQMARGRGEGLQSGVNLEKEGSLCLGPRRTPGSNGNRPAIKKRTNAGEPRRGALIG